MTTQIMDSMEGKEVSDQVGEKFFNLIDEPWIPVLFDDGTEAELSVQDVFDQAESIHQIHGELPTMQPAIFRILVAIMTRALGTPAGIEDWDRKSDEWDDVVSAVTDYLEKHHDRFWLKHPAHPFFQVNDLGPKSGDTKDLGTIVADFPSNVQLFSQRGPESLTQMSPAEATRWLIHTQAYDVSGIKTPDRRDPRVKGGRVYPLGQSWCGKGEVLIASADDLAFSLFLNYLDPEVVGVRTSDSDLPPWERSHPSALEEFDFPAEPEGFIQVYTWQARRLRLVFDGEKVTRVVLCYGDPLAEQNRDHLDPMMTWRYSKPQSTKLDATVFMPGIVDTTKDIWRGLAAWLPTKAQRIVKDRKASDGQPQNKEPAVLTWIGKLSAAGYLGTGFMPNISIFGVSYGPQNATYADILGDSLTIPPFLLEEDAVDSASTVIEAIDDADAIAWYLGTFASNLAKAQGIDNFDTPRDEAKEEAYLLFGRLFQHWLSLLEQDTDWHHARADWQRALRQAAINIAEELGEVAGENAYVGRIVDTENGTWLNTALALRYLHKGLHKVLKLAYQEDQDDR